MLNSRITVFSISRSIYHTSDYDAVCCGPHEFPRSIGGIVLRKMKKGLPKSYSKYIFKGKIDKTLMNSDGSLMRKLDHIYWETL